MGKKVFMFLVFLAFFVQAILLVMIYNFINILKLM